MTRGKAVVYRVSIPRYLLGQALGSRLPWVFWGAPGPLSLRDLPEPQAPGPGFATLRPRLSGICGSDVAIVRGKTSPAQSPFHSFPAVLGHEVLADVVDPADHPLRGRRVVVDPVVSCFVRGEEPCSACAAGQTQRCERRSSKSGIGPGTLIGYHARLPGGFSRRMLAHETQLYPVPDAVSDELAVLTEPYSIALHAVLRRPPKPGEKVLVLGSGAIGLLTLLALRLHGEGAEVHAVARHPHQRRFALTLGASRAYGHQGATVAVQAAVGAELLRPLLGQPVFSVGFDLVYDCVGSAQSLADALRVTRPGGTLVLVGTAGSLTVDWSFVWASELQLLGTFGYGREAGGEHTFALALRDLATPEAAPAAGLITHRYRLEEYRQAMRAHLSAGAERPLKAVFDLRELD
ncbi:MAG: zinc-binding dehydrogenase [Thermaerobacter sp.]|nr:zinc-binding dehydrogenase [Thermaerobacter sp.]